MTCQQVKYIHNLQVKMAVMEVEMTQMKTKASHIETGTLVYDNMQSPGAWTTTQTYHVGYYDMQYLDQVTGCCFLKSYRTNHRTVNYRIQGDTYTRYGDNLQNLC